MTDHTEMQIPDDVMEAAHRAFDIAYHAEDDVERYAVIARAILAERERCARISENYDHGVYAAEAIRGLLE